MAVQQRGGGRTSGRLRGAGEGADDGVPVQKRRAALVGLASRLGAGLLRSDGEPSRAVGPEIRPVAGVFPLQEKMAEVPLVGYWFACFSFY